MGTARVVENVMERLAAFEPVPFPVISLYLDTQAGPHGKDRHQPFVRKELRARAATYPLRSPERDSFEADIERIEKYLFEQLQPSSNGAAIFACSAAGLFEAVQLEAPIEENELHVLNQPHLFTLARLSDTYRRYIAVVLDTHLARIFVFGLRQVERRDDIANPKVSLSRNDVGGWSQTRYQRHVEEFHVRHAREIVEMLDRITRQERIDAVVLAGDEVILPVLKEQMPKHLAEKVVEIIRLDIRAPEHEVLEASLQAMRGHDARTDAEKVERLLSEFRSGGLGAVGAKQTRRALQLGQVDELLLAADLDDEALSAELVAQAKRTGALVTIIEDSALLREAGGAGALLRFKL
ncbi:MAG: host attachment protein [Bryobacterales bacterium]|nr:host attachment protein [Bryobacterales bacterium]